MKTKDITPLQYASWYGCSLQYVTKHLREGKALPGILKVKKFSRFYLLEVDKEMDAATFEEINVKSLTVNIQKKKK